MDQERRNHLLSIIANAGKAHKEWVEKGDSTIVPEDDIYQRFQEIADQAKVIYRANAEQLEQLYLNFSPHWQAFVSQQQATMDTTMLPSESFWRAWEALSNFHVTARMPKLKRIEPVADLRAQKVPDRQICMIYGFMDDDGNPDYEKLQEEINEPGTHTGPSTGWIAPVNREIAAKIQQMQLEADTLNRRRDAKVAAATTPAKESIEQLVVSGVSAKQISNLRKITVEEVYEYCAEHNLPKPPYDYTGALLSPAAHDPDISAERQQAMDSLGADRSQQFVQPRHPMLETPSVGPQGDADDDDVPDGLDLSNIPPEEANAIQEAYGYFTQGMEISAIASAMNVHGNKVRALLTKAGIDLSQRTAAAG